MTRLLAAIAPLLAVAVAPADDFDRLEGRVLAALPDHPDATRHDRLTLAELAALPNVLERVRSPMVVVRTDRGNLGRVLVSPGFRSPPPGAAAGPDDRPEPVPILALERFATFEAGGGPSPDRLAAGREILLFDGFHFDLDSGQVVPEGQGGDLAFVASGADGPRLEAIGGATFYTLSTAPELPEAGPGSPSPGRAVLPGDYAGRYRLFADGTLSGTLDLAIAGRGLSGRFRSDQTGTSYEVRGEVEPGPDPGVRFSIRFPRSRQDYEARLFSEGKGAIAGSVVLVDRERPFFAVREGGAVAPEGGDAPDLSRPADQP